MTIGPRISRNLEVIKGAVSSATDVKICQWALLYCPFLVYPKDPMT